MSPAQLASTSSSPSSPSCSPCMAIFFILGVFGGYVATTILNAGPSNNNRGESGQKDESTHTSGAGQNMTEDIDDEGNVIVVPAPTNKKEVKVEEPKKAVTTERALSQSAPFDVTSKVVTKSSPPPTSSSSVSEHGAVKLVIQRFRTASLLLAPNETVHVDSCNGCGLLVYISFSKLAETNKSAVFTAAKTVLNLPVLTKGVWGDGSGTASILDLASDMDKKKKEKKKQQQSSDGSNDRANDTSNSGVPIVLVPQANLVSKVKNAGKSIQYHGQVAKSLGEELYDTFVKSVELIALEHQHITRGQPISPSLRKAIVDVGGTPSDSNSKGGGGGGGGTVDPSVPPDQMFMDSTLYGSWDDAGFPLTKVDGESPTKSAIKKMKKQYAAQKKRYDKYLALGGGGDKRDDPAKTAAAAARDKNEEKGGDAPKLDPRYIRVVAGTFGNLQALDFSSDMGPFCHLVNVG